MSAVGVPPGRGSIHLRDLRWTDIERLVHLEVEAFGADAWPEPTWWRELAARPRRWYVAAIDDRADLIGYAGVDLAGETADVMTIAVAPTARGAGAGQLLLGALIDRASDCGAQALLLEVRADNTAALNLYARNGFDRIAVRARYYQPDGVDALVLRRLIGVTPTGETVTDD